MDTKPNFLYKILSDDNWNQSQGKTDLKLSNLDSVFIHLSTEEQLDRIKNKFWADEKRFYILKLDCKKLKGKLVLESNPGGSNKYYHLYNGSIPLTSIVEIKENKN